MTTERCSFYATNHYIHFYVSRTFFIFSRNLSALVVFTIRAVCERQKCIKSKEIRKNQFFDDKSFLFLDLLKFSSLKGNANLKSGLSQSRYQNVLIIVIA